jgi:hypothetical protein
MAALFRRKKKRDAVGKTKRGKGTKWLVLGDGEGVLLESASLAEIALAGATFSEVCVPRPRGCPPQKPKRVIADHGYDSDPLRERWKRRGIERTNAWLGQFRRRLVRHEHLLTTYRASSISSASGSPCEKRL